MESSPPVQDTELNRVYQLAPHAPLVTEMLTKKDCLPVHRWLSHPRDPFRCLLARVVRREAERWRGCYDLENASLEQVLMAGHSNKGNSTREYVYQAWIETQQLEREFRAGRVGRSRERT